MMSSRVARAFTLIELLVVLGLIALLMGGLGLGLREGQAAGALQTGQGMMASLLSAARGQAALTQRRVLLVVEAEAESEDFLRRIHLVYETTPGSDRWEGRSDGVLLPAGIFVVPGLANVSGAAFAAGSAAWPARRRSSLEPAMAGRITTPTGQGGGYLRMTAPFEVAESGAAGGGERLVLAVARRTATGVEFANPEAVRGVVLSSYGVAVLVNEGVGFEF